MQFCQAQKGLIIYAWVLMTIHLHMIVGGNEDNNVSDIMVDFKTFKSKKILRVLKTDIQESHREWMLNRFEYAGSNDKKKTNYRFGQKANDAQEIFLQDYFNQKLNYIHQNPVRAEIVSYPEDYRYSSAVDNAGGKGLLKVIVV